MREKVKDVIAGIFSIVFIGIVFYLYFMQIFSIHKINTEEFIVYNQTEHHSCVVTLTEPTIILRLDDVRAYSNISQKVIDTFLSKNLSVTLGVIPKDLEKDRTIVNYLISIKNNSLVEIAQHGFYHNKSDINITKEEAILGHSKIQKVLGVFPVTYIPPYNKVSNVSNLMIFKIISGSDDNLIEGNIVEIGQTIGVYDYQENYTIPIETIIDQCKKAIFQKNVCVITFHPQEFNDLIKLNQVLDEIAKINASFKNFKDIVYCEK